MPGIDYERALNPEQRAAVQAPDGPVLVIAAAGTGKTRTLTYRVAHLVDRGIDPQRMLLLTFTNRAAAEMLERARALVGESVGGIWGGTFHHLANRMLRRHAPKLGFPSDYTILDQDDALGLVRACVADLGLRDRHFPKAEVLLGLFGLARNREAPLEATVERHFRGAYVEPGAVVRVGAAYAQRKRALAAMDFDDLLVFALELLRAQAAVRESYRERFLHVLVDEYQDTNPLQAELVDALAGRHRNLLVVGDDFQSIYSWRGADFENFLSFPRRYADAHVFKLETNYRSVPGILAVANACIAGNPRQFQKTLRPVRTDGAAPVLAHLRDGQQQARYVLERLYHALRAGYRPRDVAVLYRSHFHAMELQLELARENIPYAITSGVRFFEQAHVKDACCLLRLAHNPADELSFVRLLRLLPRVGERVARRVWADGGGRFAPLDPAAARAVGARLPAAAREDWRALFDLFAGAAEEKLAERPGEIVQRFVSGFYERYAAENFENYERRLEDLEELVAFTARFPGLGEFLSEVALLTNVDAEAADPAADPKDAVLLSTVHQAKGLEWPVVFVLWLAEGLFPSGRSLQEGAGEAEAEERRLFYVATTRAKDELYLCVPQLRRTRDGDTAYYAPSRFVREIPPALLHHDRVSPYG